MRNMFIAVWVIVLSSLFLQSCATIHRMDSTQLNIVPISTMTENPSKWRDIGKEIENGKTVVFSVAQGQRLPLKLVMDLPIGKIEKSMNTLLFSRDVYLSMSRTGFEVSPDGQQWASVDDLKSMRKLFGYTKGEVAVSLSATETEGTSISVAISAK